MFFWHPKWSRIKNVFLSRALLFFQGPTTLKKKQYYTDIFVYLQVYDDFDTTENKNDYKNLIKCHMRYAVQCQMYLYILPTKQNSRFTIFVDQISPIMYVAVDLVTHTNLYAFITLGVQPRCIDLWIYIRHNLFYIIYVYIHI